MDTDKIKLIFTYATALVVVAAGFMFLYVTRLDPAESSSREYGIAVVGFLSLVLGFLFGAESATRASRASERAAKAGAESALAVPGTKVGTDTAGETIVSHVVEPDLNRDGIEGPR